MVKDVNNLRMNDKVYVLRRRVIELIYEVKREFNIPRINARITEIKKHYLGCACVGRGLNIWITEESTGFNIDKLRFIVLHELIHTIAKYKGHDKKCLLMCSSVPLTIPKKELIYKRFGVLLNGRY